MGILNISYYTFLKNIRDWKYVALLIIAPLVTIMITGYSTSNIDKHTLTTKKVIAVYIEDKGDISDKFNTLLKSPDVKNAFDIRFESSYNDGYNMVLYGKADTFIYLGKGLSKSFNSSGNSGIKVYSDNSVPAAKLLVEGFENSLNTINAISGIKSKPVIADVPNAVNEVSVQPIGKTPSGLDRWTYLNMLIFLFYGALLGSFGVINGVRKNTLLRFNIAPIGRYSNVTGQFLGNLLTLFLCSAVTIIASRLLFGSNWNGNIVLILLSFLFYSSISISLGMIFGYISRKISLCTVVILCVNVLFVNATNALSPDVGFFKYVNIVSPHNYVYKAITNTVFSGADSKSLASVAALAIEAILLFVLTAAAGRRRTA
ncbi:MAG: ABC transporter permease [Bacillota bacterium]|nr:ABC transporter permease [Bacillota bacterium]